MSRGPHVTRLALLACAVVAVACVPTSDTLGGPATDPVAPTTAPAAADAPPPDTAVAAVVDRVVDGDTVVLTVDGERERARLLRIDTPEAARDGAPAECLAGEATRALERLLPPGGTVLVATDVETRDRYGRLLVHVWRGDTWVNARMLRDGWAQVVTFPPNTAYDAEVLAAQESARRDGAGLWAPGACG